MKELRRNMCIVGALVVVMLKKTPYGKKIYAVGSSQTVSSFSGIFASSVRKL